MSAADDLRDLRDALDSIAHGAMPRWGKPTTKAGEEAQRAAVGVYGRWIRALHLESAAKASIEKSLAAEDEHRTHSEILTDRIEKLEAEIERMRQRMSDQEDGLRYGEEVHAMLVKERDDARSQVRYLRADVSRREREHEALVETSQKALENVAAERDEALAERDAARSQVRAWQAEELSRRTERDEARAERDHERMVANEQLARAHDAVRERDEARAEVERLIRERDGARADIKRLRSAYERHGAAGVASVLAELHHRDGHPSDSTR